MVSSLMAAKEDELNQRDIVRIREKMAQLVTQMSTMEPFHRGLSAGPVNARSLLSCGGAAVVYGTDVAFMGECPTNEQILEITSWLEDRFAEDPVFHTDQLSTLLDGAINYRQCASGLLAMSISRVPKAAALWFRPEMAQTVRWAGDPRKPVDVEKVNGEDRLTPRSSFAVWKVSRGLSTSLP
jgi:light-regulated signal transduction histidine kinase (bacteriophytochrome)